MIGKNVLGIAEACAYKSLVTFFLWLFSLVFVWRSVVDKKLRVVTVSQEVSVGVFSSRLFFEKFLQVIYKARSLARK